jgi:hypothetical protein
MTDEQDEQNEQDELALLTTLLIDLILERKLRQLLARRNKLKQTARLTFDTIVVKFAKV